MAHLDDEGILNLYIKAGVSTPKGSAMFNEALEAFGSNVQGVRGFWRGGGELSSNFDSYQAGIRAGLTPEQAAAQTFTGKMALRAGFTHVNIEQVTKDTVQVVFTPQ
jgi:hypothetical protein